MRCHAHTTTGSRQDAELDAALSASAELSQAVEASLAEARARLRVVLNLYRVRRRKVEASGRSSRSFLLALCFGIDTHPSVGLTFAQV